MSQRSCCRCARITRAPSIDARESSSAEKTISSHARLRDRRGLSWLEEWVAGGAVRQPERAALAGPVARAVIAPGMASMRKYRSLPEGAPNGSNRPFAVRRDQPRYRRRTPENGRRPYRQDTPGAVNRGIKFSPPCAPGRGKLHCFCSRIADALGRIRRRKWPILICLDSAPYTIRTSASAYFSEDSPPTKLKYDARAAI